ncbi:hypothetical protein HMPREF1557_01278 [Streptococcus sobrinus W1703]|uniref:Uncharacterized protein n=1 Tax=Streptococcus sobrinus W1703 TaxID=1227275 RepID=U2KM85_9STRE|nr:hypothetical protein HMPREF1557_01278 [Streptococcus sobrinus W1703]
MGNLLKFPAGCELASRSHFFDQTASNCLRFHSKPAHLKWQLVWKISLIFRRFF